MEIYNGDCLNEMKNLEDKSIDLIFCDLPYGQTNCKWDSKIDLKEFWKEIMRIKKLNTPIFFTTTTKFGVELITSAPKKCSFRYDIIWVKSSPSGFLNAKRMPLRSHEMIYVFYEKLPFYDLSSHTHKFKEENDQSQITQKKFTGVNNMYGDCKGGTIGNIHGTNYEPALPTSIIKDTVLGTNTYDTEKRKKPIIRLHNEGVYEPPLPKSLLEIKSTRGNHSTEKPVQLIEWILKYYSKEGDVVLDPTMGSGSTGVACKNMNRKFIGMELDEEIFKVAQQRIKLVKKQFKK